MERTHWLVALTAFSCFAACGGSSPKPAAPTSDIAEAAPRGDADRYGEEEDESTADVADHHRHHHHGGFAMFVAMSLDSLGVSDDQRQAIMKIQSDLHRQMQPAHDAERAVLLALADGVAAGQIDNAKLDAVTAQLASTSARVHDEVVESLNALHKTLTPPQRQALVDKVAAHFEVWHHANSTDEATNKEASGHLARFADELGLSPEQIEQIRASYRDALAGRPHFDRAQADAHMKAFAAAFTSDAFDAKALASGGPVNAGMSTWGINRTVTLYKVAIPILTPAQRAKAAESLRRHASYKRTDNET